MYFREHSCSKIKVFFYSFYKEIGFWICLETMNVYLQICRLCKEKKVPSGIIDKTVVKAA
jgi:hypothetical protein